MYLNTLKPAAYSKKTSKRLGRGIGSGKGKTCGKGHKGQKSRAGGYHKIGFEGGQMPLQRRLPKFGFNSSTLKFNQEIRLSEIDRLSIPEINLQILKEKKLIRSLVKQVKIIYDRDIKKPVNVSGIKMSAKARTAIEAAGGKIEK
jgi:large subunit ribosomal protein L15